MVFVLDVAEKGQQGEEEEDGEGCEEEGEGDVVLAFLGRRGGGVSGFSLFRFLYMGL